MSNSGDFSFSDRNNFRPRNVPITIFTEAPLPLRAFILSYVIDNNILSPGSFRYIICGFIGRFPDPNNWSPENILREIVPYIETCEWYTIYDIIEAVSEKIPHYKYDLFQSSFNNKFEELGIGWKLESHKVVYRSSGELEDVKNAAIEAMQEFPNTQNDLSKAFESLSRRPEPDLNGASNHAISALEAVVKKKFNITNKTLGQIVSDKNKNGVDVFPKPLDEAVQKLWGYCNIHSRHGNEDRNIDRGDATLVVFLSATMISSLLSKSD